MRATKIVKYLEHRQIQEEHKHINDWKWNGRCVRRTILSAVKAVIWFCLSIYLSPILLSTVIFTRMVMFTELWKEKVAMNLKHWLNEPESHGRTKSQKKNLKKQTDLHQVCHRRELLQQYFLLCSLNITLTWTIWEHRGTMQVLVLHHRNSQEDTGTDVLVLTICAWIYCQKHCVVQPPPSWCTALITFYVDVLPVHSLARSKVCLELIIYKLNYIPM